MTRDITEDAAMSMLAVNDVHPSDLNPRWPIEDSDLDKDFVESIRQHGVIEPIVVRWSEHADGYELIAGERRWRAARLVGHKFIAARIYDNSGEPELSDRELVELMLIENLQRKDLDPIEEARGYAKLIELGYKQTQIAERINRSQSAIAHCVSLLKLSEEVQECVSKKQIGQSAAEALLRWSDYPEVLKVQAQAAVDGATVQELENPNWATAQNLTKARVALNLQDARFAVKLECKGCNARKKIGGYELCLKPECFDAKQAARDAELLSSAKAQDQAKLPRIADLGYGNYVALQGLGRCVPSGCRADCEKRITSLDWEDKPVEVCIDPVCHGKLAAKDARAAGKAERANADGLFAHVLERLHFGKLPKKELDKALDQVGAIVALGAMLTATKPLIAAAAKRFADRGLVVEPDLLSDRNVHGYDGVTKKLDALAGLGYHNVMLFAADLLLKYNIDQSVGNVYCQPNIARWFLGMGPEEIPGTAPAEEEDEGPSGLGIHCPVCGDEMMEEGDGHNCAYGDRNFYCCSEECVEKFEADPEQYALAAEKLADPAGEGLVDMCSEIVAEIDELDRQDEAKPPDFEADYIFTAPSGQEARVKHVADDGALVIVRSADGSEFHAQKSELRRIGGRCLNLQEEEELAAEDEQLKQIAEDVTPAKEYTDAQRRIYFVGQGLGKGDDPWFTLRRRGITYGAERVKSKNLPDRESRVEAQIDLNTYAEKHELTEVAE